MNSTARAADVRDVGPEGVELVGEQFFQAELGGGGEVHKKWGGLQPAGAKVGHSVRVSAMGQCYLAATAGKGLFHT